MSQQLKVLLVISSLALALFGGGRCAPGEDWSYVDVRPGAHMFWWLYMTTADPSSNPPLIIWLQGGPGGSSAGFGNFVEIGPLDVNQNPRKTTWYIPLPVAGQMIPAAFGPPSEAGMEQMLLFEIMCSTERKGTHNKTKWARRQLLLLHGSVFQGHHSKHLGHDGFLPSLLLVMSRPACVEACFRIDGEIKLQKASLLFIDNPVGAGYSYADTEDAFTTNVSEIADDLLTVLKAFYKRQPSFQDTPLWIFTESYGGKMTSAFSQKLVKAISDGQIKSNFKGCALGDSWISPVDSVLSWGPYLYHTSLADKPGLAKVNEGAQRAKQLLEEGKFTEATTQFGTLEDIISVVTDGVNFYNILQFDNEGLHSEKDIRKGLTTLDRLYNRHVGVYYANDALDQLMNGPIKKKLGIPANVTWGGQSEMVFTKQAGDFMKSVQDIVDYLITNTTLQVTVYSGQLDLIVDSVGTEAWVNNLKWPGLQQWNSTQWQPVLVNNQRTGFYKTFKNFSFFWILKAGHMVPADAGETALKMVDMVISKSSQ